MKCMYCGRDVENEAEYCLWCGRVFPKSSNQNNSQKTAATERENNWNNVGDSNNNQMNSMNQGNKINDMQPNFNVEYPQGSAYMQSPPIHTVIPNYNPKYDYRPIGMWGYFGYSIAFSLLAISVIGWIIIILLACGALGNNINVRNYARSMFCTIILAIILLVVCYFLGVGLLLS